MYQKHPIHAVLTGDIVNSTMLGRTEEKRLAKALDKIFSDTPFEYYRGDSFQAFLEVPAQALRTALLCRATAISLNSESAAASTDIRISIGIGTIEGTVDKPGTAKGEAFLLSGHSFDEMQESDERLSLITPNDLANVGCRILADYTNSIFNSMTGKQAAIVAGLLEGKTLQKMADKLGKSKSTIHQLSVSGRWPEIEKLLYRFENLINLLQ